MIEGLEQVQLDRPKLDMSTKLAELNKSFDSNSRALVSEYHNLHGSMDDNIARWLDVADAASLSGVGTSAFSVAKQMLNGIEINGQKSLGLKEISQWNVHPDYKAQNIKQHAGYSAEVISTAKENLQAQVTGSEIRTYRADDLPETFSKNDQYVDKVRVNAQNEIVERVQTKFVGNDGAECLSKLASKNYDKYFSEGKVDKIEIPKDYYDEIRNKNMISERISKLEKQLDRVNSEGKTDVADNIQKKIDRYNQIDEMMERSTVSSKEAISATKHPDRYTAKLFVEDVAKVGHETGVKSGLAAAGITMAVSTVENVSAYIDGEISAEEMATEIVKDTGAAAALGYGTGFVSASVSHVMSQSSSALIQKVGGSCLPAAAVSFAVESYDSISDYAQGIIDGAELAYDLGENAASVAGAIKGASIGATVGSAAGPVGTAVGGIVGGVVGAAVTSEVYATAVEVGAEGVEVLADKAQSLMQDTVKLVEDYAPESLAEVKDAFSDFISSNKLPFQL